MAVNFGAALISQNVEGLAIADSFVRFRQAFGRIF